MDGTNQIMTVNLLIILGVAGIGFVQLLYSSYTIMISLPLFLKNKYRNYLVNSNSCSLMSIAILIPLYKESYDSIAKTLKSIINQNYKKEKMNIILIIEQDDEYTKRNANLLVNNIKKDIDININIIYSSCRNNNSGKSCALNTALDIITEDVIFVFDADDDIPSDYLEKAICMIKNGYTAVTTKVYREGTSIISKFLTLDTILWYDLFIYTPYVLGGYIPLSGEGLAVKTKYLKEIGGFPNKLTEDAYLSINLAIDKQKIAYLNSLYIVERAPRSLKSYVKQRLRWMQGFLESFKDLVINFVKGKLEIKTIYLALCFFSPVVASVTMFSYLIMILYWILYIFSINSAISAYHILFPSPIFYWSLTNLILGNLLLLYIILYTIGDTERSHLAPYALLLPLYWFMLGIIATASFFIRKEWRKTER